jgi:hypothetical protein
MRRFWLIFLLILAGCNRNTNEVLPTVAEPSALATALILTEFAPPVGYETISLPNIDANVEHLSGWRAEMLFSFNGLYSRTSRTAAASTQASVYYDQVGTARRVLATVDTDLEEASDPIQYEGVRLGPDVFLVRSERCVRASEEDASLLADLSAGALIGGIQNAQVEPRIETINGERVWLYRFRAEDLVMPNLRLPADSRILSMTGELWFSPTRDAVIRFYVTLQVENALLFNQTLPVSGEVLLRYDLFEIGTVPNITQPNGC